MTSRIRRSGVPCVTREEPEEQREERHRERLRAGRREHLDQQDRRRQRGDPHRRASEAAGGGDRDEQAAGQQHAVREVHERQAADGVEAIRGEVREPLLVLPWMPGRERHQAVAVGQPVLHDVAPRDQVEPRVSGDPAGCLEEQAEREQQQRQRQQRVGDRAVDGARDSRERVCAARRLVLDTHNGVIGRYAAMIESDPGPARSPVRVRRRSSMPPMRGWC